MISFNRNDLRYDYAWLPYINNDPRVCGELDDHILNRERGLEVLYFINKFAEIYNAQECACGYKIERMIHTAPLDIRSQEDMRKWILNNWTEY